MNVGGRNVSGSTRGDSDEPEGEDFEVDVPDVDEEDENNPDDRLPTPGFVLLDADAGAGEATIYGRLRVLDSATVYDGGSCERGSWW